MLTLYGIKNCDTVKKARAWLDAEGLAYRFHDFKTEGVSRQTLEDWCRAVGHAILLNKAGTTFRALPEADKADIDEAKAIALMHAQPTIIKRPVIEGGKALSVGFKPEAFAANFL